MVSEFSLPKKDMKASQSHHLIKPSPPPPTKHIWYSHLPSIIHGNSTVEKDTHIKKKLQIVRRGSYLDWEY